jgi:hypothetical protein
MRRILALKFADEEKFLAEHPFWTVERRVVDRLDNDFRPNESSQLIEFLQTHPFTDEQGYNLLTADVEKDWTTERVTRFLSDQIRSVLFPVIRAQKEKLDSVGRAEKVEGPIIAAGLRQDLMHTKCRRRCT